MIDPQKREAAIIRESVIFAMRKVKDWLDSDELGLNPSDRSKFSFALLTIKKRFDQINYVQLCDFVQILTAVRHSIESGEIPPQVLALMEEDETAAQILADYNKEEMQASLKEAAPYISRILDSLLEGFQTAKDRIERERAVA